MTSKELIKQIKELKKNMRMQKIRKTSCFNGGLNPEEYRCNSLLFALNVKLENAIKDEKI